VALPLATGLLEGVEGCGVILEFDGQRSASKSVRKTRFGLAPIEQGAEAGKLNAQGGRQGNGQGDGVGVCPPPGAGRGKARSSLLGPGPSRPGSLRRSSHSA